VEKLPVDCKTVLANKIFNNIFYIDISPTNYIKSSNRVLTIYQTTATIIVNKQIGSTTKGLANAA